MKGVGFHASNGNAASAIVNIEDMLRFCLGYLPQLSPDTIDTTISFGLNDKSFQVASFLFLSSSHFRAEVALHLSKTTPPLRV